MSYVRSQRDELVLDIKHLILDIRYWILDISTNSQATNIIIILCLVSFFNTMIARLTGTPIISGNTLIIDVHDVGYAVFVTAETLTWASIQSTITISIYTHVTETSLDLFGFKDEAEKQLFLLLIGVSGVGPKTALGILNMGQTKAIHALQQADISFFSKAPRVGKKLAQKIIIELGNKVGGIAELNLKPLSSKETDIVEALMALGYDEHVAQKSIEQFDLETLSVQEVIKLVMKKKV